MADAFVGVLKRSVESNAVKEHKKRLLTCELGSFVVLGWGLPLLLRISRVGVHSEFVGHQVCFVRETLSTDSASAWTVLMFDEAFGAHRRLMRPSARMRVREQLFSGQPRIFPSPDDEFCYLAPAEWKKGAPWP